MWVAPVRRLRARARRCKMGVPSHQRAMASSPSPPSRLHFSIPVLAAALGLVAILSGCAQTESPPTGHPVQRWG